MLECAPLFASSGTSWTTLAQVCRAKNTSSQTIVSPSVAVSCSFLPSWSSFRSLLAITTELRSDPLACKSQTACHRLHGDSCQERMLGLREPRRNELLEQL